MSRQNTSGSEKRWLGQDECGHGGCERPAVTWTHWQHGIVPMCAKCEDIAPCPGCGQGSLHSARHPNAAIEKGDFVRGIDYGNPYLVLGRNTPHHRNELICFDFHAVDLIPAFDNQKRKKKYRLGGVRAEFEYLAELVLNADRDLPTTKRGEVGVHRVDLEKDRRSVLGVRDEGRK